METHKAGTKQTEPIAPVVNDEYRKALAARAKWAEESEKLKETELALKVAVQNAAVAYYANLEAADSKAVDVIAKTATLMIRFPETSKSDILKLLKDTDKANDLPRPGTVYVRQGQNVGSKAGTPQKNYGPKASKLFKLSCWEAGVFDPKRDTAEGQRNLMQFGVSLRGSTYFSVVSALNDGHGVNAVDAAFTAVLRPVTERPLENADKAFDEARKAATKVKVVIYDPSAVTEKGGRPTRNVKVADDPAVMAGMIVGLIEASASHQFTKTQSSALMRVGKLLAAGHIPVEDQPEPKPVTETPETPDVAADAA